MGIVEDALAQTVLELRERVRTLEAEIGELKRNPPPKNDGKERKRERDKRRYEKRKVTEKGGNTAEKSGTVADFATETAVFGRGVRGESRFAALSPLPPPPYPEEHVTRLHIDPTGEDRDWRSMMKPKKQGMS